MTGNSIALRPRRCLSDQSKVRWTLAAMSSTRPRRPPTAWRFFPRTALFGRALGAASACPNAPPFGGRGVGRQPAPCTTRAKRKPSGRLNAAVRTGLHDPRWARQHINLGRPKHWTWPPTNPSPRTRSFGAQSGSFPTGEQTVPTARRSKQSQAHSHFCHKSFEWAARYHQSAWPGGYWSHS